LTSPVSASLLPAGDVDWLLNEATREEAQRYYSGLWDACTSSDGKGTWGPIAELGRADRFFLLTWVLNRVDANTDWLYARCREVEKAPDGHLDLWARFHYKSTLITIAGLIQEIVRNPEVTIAILSHNNETARGFQGQIKQELEGNARLLNAYPDVLFAKPEKQSPLWSREKGIVVRRKAVRKEPTVGGYGLVDGMPTGYHFDILMYDDVVTKDSVTTPDQIRKTTEAWELSSFLGHPATRKRYAGTRYHFNDTYSTIMERDVVTSRIYPATKNGAPDGEPVLMTPESIIEFRKTNGPYVYSCQLLLNPVADDVQGFKREWMRYYTQEEFSWEAMNRYILVDPASEKKKTSDYTVMWVVGLGTDRNYYVIDCVRDRLNLTERADCLFSLHRKYSPRAVGYEKYGIQADVEHIQYRMKQDNYRFSITDLGGNVKKEDRIRMLVPVFEQGQIWFPEEMWVVADNRRIDLVDVFVKTELESFPVSAHDDMLDCLARILDPDMPKVWPRPSDEKRVQEKKDRYRGKRIQRGSWLSA